MPKNQLYYGDNLTVLRDYVKDESVDLIYLDPPFNSRADYNVLFAEKDGTRSSSQITAFEDTWEWNLDAERAYQEVVEGGGQVADAMRAFRTFLGHSDMMAYLAMMAPRLIELKRVLKATGSIYLHCDPTASHYLKMLMDAVFGVEAFRSEIIWKRTNTHSDAKRWSPVSDTIFYAGGDSNVELSICAPLRRAHRIQVSEFRSRWPALHAFRYDKPKAPAEHDVRVEGLPFTTVRMALLARDDGRAGQVSIRGVGAVAGGCAACRTGAARRGQGHRRQAVLPRR